MSENKKRGERVLARVKDYQNVFNSASGKRVLNDMMDVHHVLHSSFDPNSATQMAFREGERNVVLRILTLLKVKPDELRKKIEERNDDNGY